MHLLVVDFKNVRGEGPLGDEVEVIFRSAQEICARVIGGVSAPVFRYATKTPVDYICICKVK